MKSATSPLDVLIAAQREREIDNAVSRATSELRIASRIAEDLGQWKRAYELAQSALELGR